MTVMIMVLVMAVEMTMMMTTTLLLMVMMMLATKYCRRLRRYTGTGSPNAKRDDPFTPDWPQLRRPRT